MKEEELKQEGFILHFEIMKCLFELLIVVVLVMLKLINLLLLELLVVKVILLILVQCLKLYLRFGYQFDQLILQSEMMMYQKVFELFQQKLGQVMKHIFHQIQLEQDMPKDKTQYQEHYYNQMKLVMEYLLCFH